jgi:hypothetical protein
MVTCAWAAAGSRSRNPVRRTRWRIGAANLACRCAPLNEA